MTEEHDESFISRWSRRKTGARTTDLPPGDATAPVTRAPPADRSDRPVEIGEEAKGVAGPLRPLTEEDFADVDFTALDSTSDYTRFMGANVPDSIRNRALARLWVSDPILSAPDPFSDCVGDFTDAAMAVPEGTLQTAYRFGRGFLSDEEVATWEKLGRPEAVEGAPDPATAHAEGATSATGQTSAAIAVVEGGTSPESEATGGEARRAVAAVLAQAPASNSPT